jgi:hypothetical protein
MVSVTFDLARPYPVDAASCLRYRQEGHILLRGVAAPEEIEFYSPLVTGLIDKYAKTRDVQVGLSRTRPLLEYVANVWQKSEDVKEFVLAKRFARIAAGLMGVRGVRLYHDEVTVKKPGALPAPWHKDHLDWPLATHHTIKMWLALADISLDMAAIRYASGSQHSGRFPEIFPSYESDEMFNRIIHDRNIPIVTYSMKARDASFHS